MSDLFLARRCIGRVNTEACSEDERPDHFGAVFVPSVYEKAQQHDVISVGCRCWVVLQQLGKMTGGKTRKYYVERIKMKVKDGCQEMNEIESKLRTMGEEPE